jgi:hypothetical protein
MWQKNNSNRNKIKNKNKIMYILIMIIKNHGHNVMFHITYDRYHMSLHVFVPQRQGIHVDFHAITITKCGSKSLVPIRWTNDSTKFPIGSI